MTSKFIEIYDPKRRNEIIEENLKLRKKLKNRFDQNEIIENEIQEHNKQFFKPLIESNENLQAKIIEDQNKMVNLLSNFNQLQIESSPPEQLAIEDSKKSENLIVSNLIANYLKDLTDRSNAGYSIRYNSENNIYTIGNKNIEFDNNALKIDNKIYNATNGLMELLLKKSPNFTLINDTDIKFYKEILDNS